MIKVYGPYAGQKGRKHVIHYDAALKTRRTQSYARYLMEQHLGRALSKDESVDHINGDRTDDRIENLQILSPADNNRKAVVEHGRTAKLHYFNCPVCNSEASVLLRKYRQNQIVQGKAGPYCSRQCAGKAHN